MLPRKGKIVNSSLQLRNFPVCPQLLCHQAAAVMLKQGVVNQTVASIFGKRNYKHHDGKVSAANNLFLARKIVKLCDMNARMSYKLRYAHLDLRAGSGPLECNTIGNGVTEDLVEEDDELCPVDCVKEFQTDEEFQKILEKAKFTNTLVVVDFYRTSCGSCKYIEQGFAKLCKGSGEKEAPVIFLKHNVSVISGFLLFT